MNSFDLFFFLLQKYNCMNFENLQIFQQIFIENLFFLLAEMIFLRLCYIFVMFQHCHCVPMTPMTDPMLTINDLPNVYQLDTTIEEDRVIAASLNGKVYLNILSKFNFFFLERPFKFLNYRNA